MLLGKYIDTDNVANDNKFAPARTVFLYRKGQA